MSCWLGKAQCPLLLAQPPLPLCSSHPSVQASGQFAALSPEPSVQGYDPESVCFVLAHIPSKLRPAGVLLSVVVVLGLVRLKRDVRTKETSAFTHHRCILGEICPH